ncbi:MAG TPA: GDSL-type esterase/lipase family protein [Solirubrobacteraceae bacterium]|jgi:lysophospholipase L1-like esterase
MSKGRYIGVLSAIAALAAIALQSTASAAGRLPVTPGSGYLALGDSVTFGYEESNVVPTPNYHKASNFYGYPEQIGPQLRLQVANAACPGETSSSLINPRAESNGCENTLGKGVGYRTAFPLHAGYRGSQLAYGVSYLKTHRNVRLVSLMIGANDYFVCVEITRDSCTARSEQAAVLTKLAKNVRAILSAIRRNARYTGQIAIVNYYSLNYASAVSSAQSAALNTVVDGAARPFGAEIAPSFELMRLASFQSGAQGDTCKAGLLTQLSTGQCGVHPSYAGQALLAQALTKAIRIR